MPLEQNSELGKGGAGFHGSGPGSAAAMIRELQGITQTVVAGAAASTNIPVPGIGAGDTILSAVMFAAGVPSMVPASVTSAGNIQSTTDTTGSQLLVTYFKKEGA